MVLPSFYHNPQILLLSHPKSSEMNLLYNLYSSLVIFSTITAVQAEDWSFMVLADFHGSNQYTNYPLQDGQTDEKVETIRSIGQTYGGELALLPGDSNSYGGKPTQEFVDKFGGTPEEAVYQGAYNCYTSVRKMFGMAGYKTLLAAVGDHEIGGNKGFVKVTEKNSKLNTIPALRKAFEDGYNRNQMGEYIVDERIYFGNASWPSRPVGTDYEGTSFAYIHKNVLFVTVDAFMQVTDDYENYIDKETGRGGEGTITCTVKDSHLSWFRNIISEGNRSEDVNHIIVQAHLPIIQPVRKVSCSGQFFDDARESEFWKIMNDNDVDIYFAGEVHSNTASLSRDGSNLVQIVSRSRAFNNFLKVEVSDESLEVISYNEIGEKPKWNGKYEEQGRLIVNKVSKTVTGTGVLELINPEAPLIHFDFNSSSALGSRQVPGLTSDDSLIATEVNIRDSNCKEAIENKGEFGVQYDAQVTKIYTIADARKEGSNAGLFTESSRMAIFGVGPYSGGQPVSFSIWFKTVVTDKDMILMHYGDTYGNFLSAWNYKKNHFTLVLENGVPALYTQIGTKAKSSLKQKLNDDEWHKIDVSMPTHSCRLSQVDLYVDGHVQPKIVEGSNSHLFALTSGNLSLGGFGYSSRNHEEAYPNLSPFSGMIDDFKLYNRPLNPNGDLFTVVQSKGCDKSNPEGFNIKKVPGNCSRKCLKRKACFGYEKKRTEPKHCILFREKVGLGEAEDGVSCSLKILA